MSDAFECKNCGSSIFRGQNYPMDGGWYWLHVVSRSSHCTMFAEPVRTGPVGEEAEPKNLAGEENRQP